MRVGDSEPHSFFAFSSWIILILNKDKQTPTRASALVRSLADILCPQAPRAPASRLLLWINLRPPWILNRFQS